MIIKISKSYIYTFIIIFFLNSIFKIVYASESTIASHRQEEIIKLASKIKVIGNDTTKRTFFVGVGRSPHALISEIKNKGHIDTIGLPLSGFNQDLRVLEIQGITLKKLYKHLDNYFPNIKKKDMSKLKFVLVDTAMSGKSIINVKKYLGPYLKKKYGDQVKVQYLALTTPYNYFQHTLISGWCALRSGHVSRNNVRDLPEGQPTILRQFALSKISVCMEIPLRPAHRDTRLVPFKRHQPLINRWIYKILIYERSLRLYNYGIKEIWLEAYPEISQALEKQEFDNSCPYDSFYLE